MQHFRRSELSELVGLTIEHVDVIKDDSVRFATNCGKVFDLYHHNIDGEDVRLLYTGHGPKLLKGHQILDAVQSFDGATHKVFRFSGANVAPVLIQWDMRSRPDIHRMDIQFVRKV